jgi:uncharacterized protein DUF6159
VQAYPTEQGAPWREGKVARGWRLTQVAWALIRADRTMMVLAVAGIVSSIFFAFLVFLIAAAASSNHSGGRLGAATLIALYPSTLASVFFNVALAGAASAAFDGERLSAREALRLAWGKRRRIALWALISVLIGTLLNEIANRLPGGGRIVTWLAGTAWGLATLFVVPILAMEGIGPVDAVKRSAGVVKKRWGEGVSGRVAIGAWSVIAAVPLVIALAIGGALLQQHPGAGVALIGGSLIGLFAVFAAVAATQQVFAVALYRYAIDAPIGGFSTADLQYPFVADRERQKRKSWILRIGGAFLAFFLVLVAIAAIVGPRHHTGAEGYFHVEYAPSQAADLSAGAPVVFHRHLVGNVVATEFDGAAVKVEFHTYPRLRNIVETTPAYVDHFRGRAYLRIGGGPPRPPTQRQSPSQL